MTKMRWFKGSNSLEDAISVRRKVFVEEQNVPEEIELDDIDEFAEHIVIYENQKPIGTGRIYENDGKAFIGRIAVLKEYRGKHFGEIVVKMLINRSYNKQSEELYVHSQTKVEKFYETFGFKPFGEKYEEAGIEHINMVLTK